MSRFACLLVASSVTLTPYAAVAGAIIFDNNVVPNDAQRYGGDIGALADDFQLAPGATTITDFHWTGAYLGGAPPVTDTFRIHILADQSGLPSGPPLHSLVVNPSRQDTGMDVVGSDLYEYSVDVAPIPLLANTVYWLSIDPDDEVGSLWYWSTNHLPTGNNAVSNDLITWIPMIDLHRGEFDFQITGVAEPATILLLGLAFAGLVGRGRPKGKDALI